MGPIKKIESTALPLRGDDIDTDRIIPARFLRCVTFDGLGENAFRDERFGADSKPLAHPMNEVKYKGAEIIFTGDNFGCGSSREHAPQAIKRAGYKAIIAGSFAEIFYGNSSVLGLVCAVMPKAEIDKIISHIEQNPKAHVVLDIEKKKVTVDGKEYAVSVKDTLHSALLDGTYDTLPELMQNKDKIAALNNALPPVY